MEIYINTTAGEIICCKSLILGRDGDLFVVANEVGFKVLVSTKSNCDYVLSKIWREILKNEQIGKQIITYNLEMG